MPSLAEFLDRLFREGKVGFRERPGPSPSERAEAAEVLRRAFADELLELAGPPLAFEEDAALAAAEWVRQACWFLVNRDEPEEELDRRLFLALQTQDGDDKGAPGLAVSRMLESLRAATTKNNEEAWLRLARWLRWNGNQQDATAALQEGLKAALREKLSSYKIPRRIVVIAAEDVQWTPSNKVKLVEMGELIAERMAEAAPAAAS